MIERKERISGRGTELVNANRPKFDQIRDALPKNAVVFVHGPTDFNSSIFQ